MDVMRTAYRELTDVEKASLAELKKLGNDLHNKIVSLGVSRELSIARTKAEEAVMWATKHLTA